MSTEWSSTGEAMIARMRDLVTSEPRPIIARLHVGSQAVLDRIGQAAGWSSTHRNASLGALYGVPIVVGSLNTAIPLDEWGWRALNADGEIVAEGLL